MIPRKTVFLFEMAGRKRKIPLGYIPQWNSDSDDSNEWPVTPSSSPHPALDPGPPGPPGPPSPPGPPVSVPVQFPVPFPVQDDQGGNIDDYDSNSDPQSEVILPIQPQSPSQIDIVQIEEEYVSMEEAEIENADESMPMVEEEEPVPIQENHWEESEDEEEFRDLDQEYLWSDFEEEEDKESFQYVLRKFSEDWLFNENNHKVSKIASSEFWNITRKWISSLYSAFVKEKKTKFPKFDHIRRKLVKQKVPRISLRTAYVNKDTKELSVAEDTDKIPVLHFPPNQYEKVFKIASVKVHTQLYSNIFLAQLQFYILCALRIRSSLLFSIFRLYLFFNLYLSNSL